MKGSLPSAGMSGAGAALLAAVVAAASCILPEYTETGASASGASSDMGGASSASTTAGGNGAGGNGGPGTALWQQKANLQPTIGTSSANGVAVTPMGEILVTGQGAQFDFGAMCMAQQIEGLAYVARLGDVDGKCLTLTTYANAVESKAIASDDKGVACFGGRFVESLTVGSTTVTTMPGGRSPFVAKEGSWVVGSTNAVMGKGMLQTNAVSTRLTDGYVFAAGQLMSPVSFGAQTAGMAGPDQAFVVRVAPSGGSVDWAFAYGGDATSSTHANGIAFEPSGRIFVVGDFLGKILVDTITLSSSDDMDPDTFVAKLDTSGKALWAKSFGGPQKQVAVAVTAFEGEIFVTGTWQGTITFGTKKLDQGNGGLGCFVAHIDKDGAPKWAVGFSTANGTIRPAGIVTDKTGNVFVTGTLTGTADFGGTSLTEMGGGDVFLVKLDKGGNVLWSRRYGDPEAQAGGGVAVASDGNIILAGSFRGALDLGLDPPLTGSTTTTQAFVAKVTP